MLVLSRKCGQQVLLGNDTVITVTKISGNRVTLSIQAPDKVRILRGELEPTALLPEVQPVRGVAPEGLDIVV